MPKTLARTMYVVVLAVVAGWLITNQDVAVGSQIATQKKVKLNTVSKLDAELVKKAKRLLPEKHTNVSPAPKDTYQRGIWLKGVLHQAGFRGNSLRTAWAIAMKESTGRPNAYNGNVYTGDNSYGLFQINMLGSLGPSRRTWFKIKSNKELFNPLTNAKAAYKMSYGGKNWYPWDIDSRGYNGGVSRGRYLHWLSQYPEGWKWKN